MKITTDYLLLPCQVSELLHMPQRTLESWRRNGRGPVFVKSGRFIRYRLSALIDWLQEGREVAK